MTDIIQGPVKQDLSSKSYSKIHQNQMDPITCLRVEQTQRDEKVFLGQLVHIDEQMETDDLELLKFVCHDVFGGGPTLPSTDPSRLQNGQTGRKHLPTHNRVVPDNRTRITSPTGLGFPGFLIVFIVIEMFYFFTSKTSDLDLASCFCRDSTMNTSNLDLWNNTRTECGVGSCVCLIVFFKEIILICIFDLALCFCINSTMKTSNPDMWNNTRTECDALKIAGCRFDDFEKQNNRQRSGLTPNDVQVTAIQTGLNAMDIEQNMIVQLNSTVLPPHYRTNAQAFPYVAVGGYPFPQRNTTSSDPLQHYAQPHPGYRVPQLHIAQQRRVNQNQRDNTTPATDSGELPVYDMFKKPRGWCVIINNRDFHVIDSESKEMPKRSGTDVDAESLQRVFGALGFNVLRRDNLIHTAMMQFLIDVAYKVDHTNFDCFVCCILTHGVLNHLYGTNGKLISIKDLTSTFQANRCPTLAGKPKLFFLQACQGQDKMTGGEANRYRDIEIDANVDLQTDSDKEIIPNEADFVIGYATFPGYVSFRSGTDGSCYIQKLCELLEKLSHKEDLLSILVHVNNEVSKAHFSLADGVFKQIPAPLVTLRKKLYFQ